MKYSKITLFLSEIWIPKIAWGVAVICTGIVLMLAVQQYFLGQPAFPEPTIEEQSINVPALNTESDTETTTMLVSANLPEFTSITNEGLSRTTNLYTVIPAKSRTEEIIYIVQAGDSVFSIANKFNLKPETVLWANYDQLNDNPNMVSIDMELVIPPVNGVYYKWQQYDNIDEVARRFEVTTEKILAYSPNKLDMTNPEIEVGTMVMIPDGWRENQQWLVPTVYRSNAGVSQTISGPGSCTLPESGGAFGTGYFVWPADNHYLSGNDYWSGHLGIDVAAATGAPIYAADSGLVVYAGAIGGGYGNMIMIDHGNGFHTLYAHLSEIYTSCGSSVYQGSVIGYAGSTGNSTGPHLHFEIRQNGAFINPWYVLP